MSGGHDDRVRGFGAFPPVARRGGRFARTWWGDAWIKAMRDTALDERPLNQGRRYACAGRVGPITVSPGRISASVQGADEVPYRTVVHVEELSGAGWERLLDQVAGQAGHIAALLEGEVPRDLVAAAGDAGVSLLPGLGDLEPECDCPEWELPCKHAAALCFQVSWLLDEDPFVLLLMRGRGAGELLADLQRRDVRLVSEVGAEEGVAAEEAYARALGRLPVPPAPPVPRGGPVLVPEASGVDPRAVEVLAAGAAARARDLLAAVGAPAVLSGWEDAVRLAAAAGPGPVWERLGAAFGRGEDLPRAVSAWRQGGRCGLEALEGAWDPPESVLARARRMLADAWEGEEPPRVRAWRNRWTVAGRGVQLRYGADGRWYPFRRAGAGRWWPAGPPSVDPVAALAGLLDA